jgi:hypothetical protein
MSSQNDLKPDPEASSPFPDPGGREITLRATGSSRRRNVAAQAASSLENRARRRMRQGLAPPRQIYDIRNRDRVDWSTLPEWARPSDPELFEGCAHEG